MCPPLPTKSPPKTRPVRCIHYYCCTLCPCDLHALRLLLNVCTIRSAAPLLAGWYGATLMCLTPFFLRKTSNSSLLNCGPLSLTICTGIPYLQNKSLRTSIVAAAVVLFIRIISGHFECASTTTKKFLPSFSAKSICTLHHGVFGP